MSEVHDTVNRPFYPFPAGSVASQSVSWSKTREGFEYDIGICNWLRRICRDEKPLPNNTIRWLKILENGRIWDRATWNVETWPWSELPRDPVTHQLAAEFFSVSRLTILEVAAYAGLSNCDRLFASGEPYEAAWVELEAIVRRVLKSGPRMKQITLGSQRRVFVTPDPPQITIDGTVYPLTANQAIYLRDLTESPGQWMSDSEFKVLHPEVGENARPDRWRKDLPRSISDRIETSTKKGSRWLA